MRAILNWLSFRGSLCWTVASGLRTQEPVGFRITCGMGRGQYILLLFVFVV